jgi:hypothetical protein
MTSALSSRLMTITALMDDHRVDVGDRELDRGDLRGTGVHRPAGLKQQIAQHQCCRLNGRVSST